MTRNNQSNGFQMTNKPLKLSLLINMQLLTLELILKQMCVRMLISLFSNAVFFNFILIKHPSITWATTSLIFCIGDFSCLAIRPVAPPPAATGQPQRQKLGTIINHIFTPLVTRMFPGGGAETPTSLHHPTAAVGGLSCPSVSNCSVTWLITW